jgi:DNA-binding transcriptional MerR regulator
VASDEAKYGIEELADRAGVSRRTVRYYVQRGLLPAPTGLGRGKHYTEEHLATLVKIRELQERGAPLTNIAAEIQGAPREAVFHEPLQSAWTRIALADGIELHVRGRRLGDEELRKLMDAVTRVIEED